LGSLKILVTGGAGFIGSHLVDRLVDVGYDIRVIDNLSTGSLENIRGHLSSGLVEFFEGDVRDASVVERCMEDVEVVFHLAAVTSVPFSVENPKVTFDVNVKGTMNLLRSCSAGKSCRFVFTSSCSVYGEPVFLPVTEEHPTNPISPYAESKLAAEKFCLGSCEKWLCDAVVLRFFNVYGPKQGLSEYGGVIRFFIDRCKRKLPLVVYGNGEQSRDFVHVSDVVEALVRSAECEAAVGEVINVGTGEAITINELAEAFLELSNLDLGISYEAARAGDIKRSYADTSKAEKLLGYHPKVCLKDGLRDLLVKSGFSGCC
jgi:UDP-glucose 4-epimerase